MIFFFLKRFGNGAATVGYYSNGEASDWMLTERGIIVMTPELGDDDDDAEYFYPDKSKFLNILRNCFIPIYSMINKLPINLM